MNPRKRELLTWAIVLAVAYPVSFSVICYMNGEPIDTWICSILAGAQVILVGPPLLMTSKRQLDWYRWSMFLPLNGATGALLGLAIEPRGLLMSSSVWALTALLCVAPFLWLGGAVFVRLRETDGTAAPTR